MKPGGSPAPSQNRSAALSPPDARTPGKLMASYPTSIRKPGEQ